MPCGMIILGVIVFFLTGPVGLVIFVLIAIAMMMAKFVAAAKGR